MRISAVRFLALFLAVVLASCNAAGGGTTNNEADQKGTHLLLPGEGPGGNGDGFGPNLTASVLSTRPAGTFWAQYLDPAAQCASGIVSHVMALTHVGTALMSAPNLCNPTAPSTALNASLFKEWAYAPKYAKYDNRILMRKTALAPYPGGSDNGGDPKAVILCDSDGVSANDQVLAFHHAIGQPVYGIRHWKKSGDDSNYVSNVFSFHLEHAGSELLVTSGAALSVRIQVSSPIGPNKYSGESTINVAYGQNAAVTETLPVTCLVHVAY